jgi:leader peptidase (prepilin peptidase) / N-methyltransferase
MVWALAALLVGLLAGRFANLLIERLPRRETWRKPLFRCAACGERPRFQELVPVAGWFTNGGRCWICRAPRPWREPVVDIAIGMLWFAIATLHDFTPRGLLVMAFAAALVVLSFIDAEIRILPDAITLPWIAIGVVATALPGWPVSLRDAALSAGLGYFGMMILAKAAEAYYREEAIGQGDWKLVAMLGAFLGPKHLLATLLIGNLMGALTGMLLTIEWGDSAKQKLPLGTFLCVAGLFMIFA